MFSDSLSQSGSVTSSGLLLVIRTHVQMVLVHSNSSCSFITPFCAVHSTSHMTDKPNKTQENEQKWIRSS